MSEWFEGLRAATLGAAAAAVLLAASSPASAQDVDDPRWSAWIGCWSAVSQADADPEAGRGVPEGVLCIRPADDAPGVEVVDPSGAFDPAAMAADGRQRPVEEDGCTGWERTVFSDDARRVYLRSEHECPGGVRRTASGLLAFVSPYEWIDVRAVEVRDRVQTWVRRYRAATAEEVGTAGLMHLAREETMARRTARMEAAAAVGVDEVVDASANVHPEAVSVWVAEQADPFDLDASDLVRMEEAGVPDDVIDVVVAVSYPERFALSDGVVREREEDPRGRRGGYASSGRTIFYGGFGGWHARPLHFWGSYYDPFLFPWAYYGVRRGGFYGWRGGFYGYRPRVVRVTPRGGDRGGRVERDSGYVPRTDGDGNREARPRTRPSGSRGGSSASTGGSGDRSRGSVSRDGGYSGGSSSTGRTARPRDTGDDEE